MEIKINKQLENNTIQFVIDEKDTKDALVQMAFFSEPDKCPDVVYDQNGTKFEGFGDKPVRWSARRVKTDEGTFTYIERTCWNGERLAKSLMGEYKEGGYYWKKWECYTKDDAGSKSSSNVRQSNDYPTEVNPDDIPF